MILPLPHKYQLYLKEKIQKIKIIYKKFLMVKKLNKILINPNKI